MIHFKILFQLLAFVMFIAIGRAATINGNGQPGCKTEEEITVAKYRNIWDPTRYWLCVNQSQPAIVVRCPDQTGFLDSIKDCVGWEDWRWEEPVAPPSEPQ